MRATITLLLLLVLLLSPSSSLPTPTSIISHPSSSRLVSHEDAKLLGLEGHPLVAPPFDEERAREKRAQEEAAAAQLAKRGVYHGRNLDFYENSFPSLSTFRSFDWNQNDPTRIVILLDKTPYLSNDTGKTFMDLSPRLENFTVVHGAHYGANSGGYGVRTVLKSPIDHNYILFLGKGTNIWKSTNGGRSFELINLRYKTDPLYLRNVILHPTQKKLLVATHIDSGCLDGSVKPTDPICSIEVYLSRDFGSTWDLVGTHTWLFYWGVYQSSSGVAKDSLYLLCNKDRSVHQTGRGVLEVLEVVTDDLKVVTVRETAREMLSIGEYIYVYGPAPGTTTPLGLYVSHLGGPFKLTSFAGGEFRGYTFIDVSEGAVLVIDTPTGVSETYSDYRGDLWVSDSSGAYFTRTLTRVMLQAGIYSDSFDIHKIESLEGTYIATSLDGQSRLRSKISWNRAGSWQDLHSQAGIDGLVDEGQNPFVLLGEIHARNAGSHMGFFSEQSAPGSVLAVGSYNVEFVDYIRGNAEGDVYYSRNGGKTFKKILDSLHYCRLLDEGSIIVCVPGDDGLTSTLLYSFDQGTTWVQETFSSEPGDVLTLTTDPDSFGLSVVITLTSNNTLRFISVDFKQLGLRPCAEADFERWMPSDSQDERHCILGHHSIFLRPKVGANCESLLNNFLVEKSNCPCGPEDFECDVGYFYNITSASCAPEQGTPVKEIHCEKGFYNADLNYRLVPGDTCDKTLPGAVDLEADISTECPVEDLIADNNYKHKLAVGLGVGVTFLLLTIIGAIGFVIWSKKKGYLQYRVLRNDEAGGGVELDMPDHPDDEPNAQ